MALATYSAYPAFHVVTRRRHSLAAPVAVAALALFVTAFLAALFFAALTSPAGEIPLPEPIPVQDMQQHPTITFPRSQSLTF